MNLQASSAARRLVASLAMSRVKAAVAANLTELKHVLEGARILEVGPPPATTNESHLRRSPKSMALAAISRQDRTVSLYLERLP
jgi:hypothetical protein